MIVDSVDFISQGRGSADFGTSKSEFERTVANRLQTTDIVYNPTGGVYYYYYYYLIKTYRRC